MVTEGFREVWQRTFDINRFGNITLMSNLRVINHDMYYFLKTQWLTEDTLVKWLQKYLENIDKEL